MLRTRCSCRCRRATDSARWSQAKQGQVRARPLGTALHRACAAAIENGAHWRKAYGCPPPARHAVCQSWRSGRRGRRRGGRGRPAPYREVGARSGQRDAVPMVCIQPLLEGTDGRWGSSAHAHLLVNEGRHSPRVRIHSGGTTTCIRPPIRGRRKAGPRGAYQDGIIPLPPGAARRAAPPAGAPAARRP
jgi:hypothetical protein